MEGCILCIHTNKSLKWPFSNEAGCIINRELIQWANTTKLLKYLTPQCNTTLNYSFQLLFRVILKYLAAFSWTVCSSICWTVCWPLDVVTIIIREHWDWKLETKKKHSDARIMIACLLLKDWTSNTLSCLESGFQLHWFWTCNRTFTNIWSEIPENQGT